MSGRRDEQVGERFGWAPSSWPVGRQATAAAGCLLAMVLLSTVICLGVVKNVDGDARRLDGVDVPYLSAVSTAALAAKGAANDERGYLLSGQARYLREARDRIDSVRGVLSTADVAASTPPQKAAVAAASAGFEQWVSSFRAEVRAFGSGHRDAAIASALGRSRDIRKRYEEQLTRAHALGVRATSGDQGSLATASSWSYHLLLGWLAVALVLGTCLAVWLVRSIAVPLDRLALLVSGLER